MRQYDSYKDSGVKWIGEIPGHWEVKRLKYFCELVTEKGTSNEGDIKISPENVESNTGFCFNLYAEYSGDGVKFTKSDILLNKLRLYLKKILFTDYEGYSMGEMIVLRIFSGVKRFYFFTFFNQGLIDELDNQSTGVKLPRVSPEIILNTKFPSPPFSEQHQIVSYLDRKTAQIDALIEQTKRKIELLKEKRTALINEVVTKGLNPNVEMKDSGVEWIGEIPRHWMVSKFKYDSSTPVQYGINISGDKYVEEGIRFVRITDISESGDLNPNEGKYLIPEDVPNEFLLRKFDVLFCRSGHTVGKTYLHTSDGLFTSGGYLVRFNFRNYTESKFIFYISKTNFYWDWIKLNTVVSTIENVNGDKYQNFIYPKPPVSEQIEIISYLDEQTQLIDKTVSIEERRIELLKEYRQSLISEVVTGKRKVVNDE